MPEYRVTARVALSDRNRNMVWSVVEPDSYAACEHVLDRFGSDYEKIEIVNCERVEPGCLDRIVRKL